VHRASEDHEDGLGLEDVELVLTNREAHRAGATLAVHDRADDEDALVDVLGAQGVLGGLGHDRLVALAADHELPAPLVDVAALLVLPDRQPPLLEQVHRAVDVAGDVGDEVVSRDAHQVVANVGHVVIDGVLTILEPDVLVDG